jgi:D-xylose 1-dehydrogenase
MTGDMSRFARYPSLADRGVLITGGASGIGASMVEHFAAQGARVGFIDLDAAAATKLLAGLGANAGNCRFAAADLRDIAALEAAIAKLRAELGRPFTVLVNNAARDDRHTIESVTPEYWDERIAVNLRHQFFAAQALREEMIAAGGGSIVNMSSISFVKAQGGMPVYLTAKSGVIGLTRALARDLGPHRIRVNSVLPGWIMTERQLELWVTPQAEGEMLRGQCIPERLYPPDIARMVLWLAADDSRLVTAQSFTVDAGWT